MCRKLCLVALVLCFVAGIAQATIVVRRPQPTVVSNLQAGSQIYFDRTPVTSPPGGHQYASVPTWLLGADYVMVANNDKSTPGYQLDVTVDQDCFLLLLIDNRIGDGVKTNGPTLTTYMPWVGTLGFVDTDPLGQLGGNNTYDIGIAESAEVPPPVTTDNWFSIYALHVTANSTTTLGTAYWPLAGTFRPQDYNMYTVAIPEPATVALLGLGALALVRRKK